MSLPREPVWPTPCRQWQQLLLDALQESLPVAAPQLQDPALLDRIATLRHTLDALPAALEADWEARRPSRELASRFAGHCLLLVFGRFNAGKSSFCNYLAQRAAAQGEVVAYFRFDAQGLAWCDDAFAEGATETTAGIQGVCLGDDLVLVDTPGLHSVTADNARLTRDFLECADGMFWLSSSSAPGQVQELDELGREIRRGKPLQPILTRSDLYEEDELDGRIVSVLCNKPAQTRALQEEDVLTRARSKLQQMQVDPDLLEAPLSLSIHAARLPGERTDVERAAGMRRLDRALQRLRAHSLIYRARKHDEVVLHHLDEQVLGRLQSELLVPGEALRSTLCAQRDALPTRLATARRQVWKATLLQMPALLDAHLQHNDSQRTVAALQQRLHSELRAALAQVLPGIVLEVPDARLDVNAATDADAMGADAFERLHLALQHAAAAWLDGCIAELQAQAEETLRAPIERCTALPQIVGSARLQLQRLHDALRQPAVETCFAEPVPAP